VAYFTESFLRDSGSDFMTNPVEPSLGYSDFNVVVYPVESSLGDSGFVR